jgi:hypothetical protein
MLASRVNDSKDLRERAAEMRASSKELKDNNTATVILRLAELYDRLAERAESRSNGGVPPSPTAWCRCDRWDLAAQSGALRGLF